MTTAAQKEKERGQVEAFAAAALANVTSIDPSEKPDFWLRRDGATDVALEITEYHPAAHGLEVEGVRRSEIESRWFSEFWPALDAKRRKRPLLRHAQAYVHFKDPRLPKRRDHDPLVSELVGLVEFLASQQSTCPRRSICAAFAPGTTQLKFPCSKWVILPAESWPRSHSHLSCVEVESFSGIEWPQWLCPALTGAFVGPSVDEFKRIFEGKTAEAKSYQLGGAPLWLLVVCDLVPDVQSHVFPRSEDNLARLTAAIQATGVSLVESPFAEVWLFSQFSQASLRLFPRE
jgi:hypothetical protein